MIWRDFLYFSSGEKRALVVLSVLVVLAVCLLATGGGEPVSCPREAMSSDTLSGELPGKSPGMSPSGRSDSAVSDSRTAARYPSNRPQPVSRPSSRTGNDSRKSDAPTSKYTPGTILELNGADSASLRKVPGIGAVFAGRIVRFRRLLGGFHHVGQLREVYGLDEERYLQLSPWFRVDSSRIEPLQVNTLSSGSLIRHPYLNAVQVRELMRLRGRKGRLSGWHDLALLEEFAEADRRRLFPYISFD